MPKQDQLPALFEQLNLGDQLPPEYDLAEWNLILAQSLPGAEDLDIPRLLNIIDDWAVVGPGRVDLDRRAAADLDNLVFLTQLQ